MQRILSTMATALIALLLLYKCTNAETIYAWGANDYGQLGLGDLENPVREPVAVTFYNDLTITSIQLTASYHIATADDGTVYVCGNNYYGCLGLNTSTGNNTYITTPQANPSLFGCSVRASKRHADAVCGTNAFGWGNWGGNVIGVTAGIYPKVHQSTSGAITNKVSSVHVINDATFVNATVGGENVVYSAGNGTYGKLGLGDQQTHAQLTQVSFFNNVPLKRIFSSQSNHICAIAKNESLFCWGSNDQGQLGLGAGVTDQFITTPTLVQAIEDGQYYISQVQYGVEHTLALSCGGAVLSWGSRQFGVIGDGSNSNSSQPEVTVVAGLTGKNIVEIVGGANSNFARSSDGTIYSWGAGYGGILGTTSDVDVAVPQVATLLASLNINHIVMGSSSRSAFGWNVPGVFTTTQNCPTLVNECLGANNCAADYSVCTDTDRLYKCSCQSGFSGDGYAASAGGTQCTDIDECAEGTDQCDPNSVCQNTIGSYLCNCNANYHGNGYTSAVAGGQGCIMNVNECDNATLNDCSAYATCTDTVWAYNCSCNDGFTGDGVHCDDVNECSAHTDTCGPNSECNNTVGSYNCPCQSGYSADENGNCNDVDECTQGTSGCDDNANCTNTQGSYLCSCNDGFSGNGSSCSAIIPTGSTGSSATVSGSTTGAATTDNSTTGTVSSGATTDASTTGQDANSTTGTSTGTGSAAPTGATTNTLDVNTIAKGDTIGPGSTSTTKSSVADNLISTTGQASESSEEKKILVGVFVGFIGLVIIVVAVIVVVVIRRRNRQTLWV